MQTIAADRRHLGARIGMTSVLHTWGSAMTHHPHVHIIVPGGGLSLDGEHWIACRTGFFLPVRVLSRLFRRLFLTGLAVAHRAGRLRFFGERVGLADPTAFAAHIAPLRRSEWVVYARAPFGGPEAVLAYLSRYTHRVAIANSRLVAADANTVTFRWKDYRVKGRHRIRHYGLFANSARLRNIETIRRLLNAAPPSEEPNSSDTAAANAEGADAVAARSLRQPCPCCGGRMIVIETFARGQAPRSRAPPPTRAA